METNTISYADIGVQVQVAAFAPARAAADEWHAMVHVEQRGESFASQAARLSAAMERLAHEPQMDGARPVVKRYFLSDAANQRPLLPDEPAVACSYIQQPPLAPEDKIAVWAYFVRSGTVTSAPGRVTLTRGALRHLWHMGIVSPSGTSAEQTAAVLDTYRRTLAGSGLTLSGDCVRTWFFVRDVDTQYAGLVRARRELFETEGLTPRTHYIASTGIGGTPADTRAIVQLGAYAIAGLEQGQQQYLYAPTHLNPTYEYGVTFERGVAIHYGDRTHALISGTASIDNRGRVVCPGDIVGQTRRMIENVEALLAEAGMGLDDAVHLIVYLRDTADATLVSRLLDERFHAVPRVITLAPVCRPGWLIEMECMAVSARADGRYADF